MEKAPVVTKGSDDQAQDKEIIKILNKTPDGSYFEKQNSRDCVIHSLNNAHGHQVISKENILAYIDTAVDRYEKKLISRGQSPKDVKKKVKHYKKTLSDKGTYFSAELVWKAAQYYGTVGDYIHVNGYSYEYASVEKTFMDWAKKMPVVVLGEIGKERHAIAVRNEMIYDSEKDGPIPLTDANMKKCLDVIYGAYAFSNPVPSTTEAV